MGPGETSCRAPQEQNSGLYPKIKGVPILFFPAGLEKEYGFAGSVFILFFLYIFFFCCGAY
jgi:hypothetical protein